MWGLFVQWGGSGGVFECVWVKCDCLSTLMDAEVGDNVYLCFDGTSNVFWELWDLVPIDLQWSGLILHNSEKITLNPFKVLAGVGWAGGIIYSMDVASESASGGKSMRRQRQLIHTMLLREKCACKLNGNVIVFSGWSVGIKQRHQYPLLWWLRQSNKVNLMKSQGLDCECKNTKAKEQLLRESLMSLQFFL